MPTPIRIPTLTQILKYTYSNVDLPDRRCVTCRWTRSDLLYSWRIYRIRPRRHDYEQAIRVVCSARIPVDPGHRGHSIDQRERRFR